MFRLTGGHWGNDLEKKTHTSSSWHVPPRLFRSHSAAFLCELHSSSSSRWELANCVSVWKGLLSLMSWAFILGVEGACYQLVTVTRHHVACLGGGWSWLGPTLEQVLRWCDPAQLSAVKLVMVKQICAAQFDSVWPKDIVKKLNKWIQYWLQIQFWSFIFILYINPSRNSICKSTYCKNILFHTKHFYSLKGERLIKESVCFILKSHHAYYRHQTTFSLSFPPFNSLYVYIWISVCFILYPLSWICGHGAVAQTLLRVCRDGMAVCIGSLCYSLNRQDGYLS